MRLIDEARDAGARRAELVYAKLLIEHHDPLDVKINDWCDAPSTPLSYPLMRAYRQGADARWAQLLDDHRHRNARRRALRAVRNLAIAAAITAAALTPLLIRCFQ